jgi:hypothetical protein
VAALLCGEETATQLQLPLEYDPKPPFDVNEENASPAVLEKLRTAAAPLLKARLESTRRSMENLEALARSTAGSDRDGAAT